MGPFPPQPTGTLTTVLSSLDRLVDLERRICSLEKDSIYDRVEAAAKGGMRQRGPLTFTKQRLPPRSNRPAQDVWAVKLQPPKPDRLSKSRKPSRRDASMNSWLNRKQARDQQKRQTVARAGRPLVRGAAGGRRGRNNAEQAFLDQKRSNQRRTDALRGLGTRRGNADLRRLAAAHGDDEPAAALAQTTGPPRRGVAMPSIGANRTGPRMGGSRMRSVPAARSYASGPRPGGRFGASGGRGHDAARGRVRPGRSPRTASVGVAGNTELGQRHTDAQLGLSTARDLLRSPRHRWSSTGALETRPRSCRPTRRPPRGLGRRTASARSRRPPSGSAGSSSALGRRPLS